MSLCLSVEAVCALHDEFPDGGSLRDRGLLESALGRPHASAFGQDAYPTLIGRAAVLLHGVSNAHAFVDANKRTAWSCCVTYLALHGLYVVGVTKVEAGEFVLAVVKGTVDLTGVGRWLNEHNTTDRPWP